MSGRALPLLLLASLLALPGRAGLAEAAAPARRQVRLLLVDTLDRGLGADRAARAGALLGQALGSLDHIEVLGVGQLLAPTDAPPAAVQAELARADNYVRKGRENLLNLSLDEAVEAFQTARVIYRRHLAWQEDPTRLIEALMGLAESLAAAGQLDAARMAYREVLGFSPDYEPDPGQVPSKLRSTFEQVRQQTIGELAGQLSIQVEPTGSMVVLDGLTAGRTPLVKGRVPAGLHMLRIHKAGFESLRRVVEVGGGQTAEVGGRLDRRVAPELIRALRAALTADAPQEDPAVLAAKLARAAGLPAVLLSQLSQPEGQSTPVLSLALVPAEGPPRVLAARLVADQEPQVVGALAWQISDALEGEAAPAAPPTSLGLDFGTALLGRPRPALPPPVVQQPPPAAVVVADQPTADSPASAPAPLPAAESTPFWETWWFWTGVGAVVAGSLATSLALTLGPERQTIYDPDQIRIRIIRNPGP